MNNLREEIKKIIRDLFVSKKDYPIDDSVLIVNNHTELLTDLFQKALASKLKEYNKKFLNKIEDAYGDDDCIQSCQEIALLRKEIEELKVKLNGTQERLEIMTGYKDEWKNKTISLRTKIEKVREVYEKYKHTDNVLGNMIFISKDNPLSQVRFDLWNAIKHLIEE